MSFFSETKTDKKKETKQDRFQVIELNHDDTGGKDSTQNKINNSISKVFI